MTDTLETPVVTPLPFTDELAAKVHALVTALDVAEAAYDAEQNRHTSAALECARDAIKAEYLYAMLNEIYQVRFANVTNAGYIEVLEQQLAGGGR